MSTVTVMDPTVLSLKEGATWSVHKSRFLGAVESPRRLFVERPAPAAPDAPLPDIPVGGSIGVAFRRGHKKCLFTSVVVGRGEYQLNDQMRVESLTLNWPDVVQELQRRAYYRAAVPRHKQVAAEIWQGGTVNRKKAGTAVWPSYTGRLIDLSAGGLRLVLNANQNPRLNIGEPVGIEFRPDPTGPTFLLNGILRYLGPMPDGTLAMGFQFTGLEATIDGRKVLQQLLRVVNQYQRCELRQARLTAEPD
jgi:hypothetical protein